MTSNDHHPTASNAVGCDTPSLLRKTHFSSSSGSALSTGAFHLAFQRPTSTPVVKPQFNALPFTHLTTALINWTIPMHASQLESFATRFHVRSTTAIPHPTLSRQQCWPAFLPRTPENWLGLVHGQRRPGLIMGRQPLAPVYDPF